MYLFTVVPIPALSTFSYSTLQGIYVVHAEQSSEAIDLFTRHLLDTIKVPLSYWSVIAPNGNVSSKRRTFEICTKDGKKAAYTIMYARICEPSGGEVVKIGGQFGSWKPADIKKTEPEPEPKLFRCMVSTNNTIASSTTYAVGLNDLLSKVKKSYDPFEIYTWHVQRSVVDVIYATYNGVLKYSIIVEEM